MSKLIPINASINANSGPPQQLHHRQCGDRLHTVSGYGMVGTGPTPGAARANLFEKIRQAGEV